MLPLGHAVADVPGPQPAAVGEPPVALKQGGPRDDAVPCIIDDDDDETEFDCQIGDLVNIGIGEARATLTSTGVVVSTHRGEDGPPRLHGLQIAQSNEKSYGTA